MNRYLDDETQKRIKEAMLRFDDRELKGKTIADSCYGSITGISFTDGTWCAVEAVDDYEGADIHHVDRLDLLDLRDLGLITEDQYKEAAVREKETKDGFKRKEIERLQAELNRAK